MRKSILILFVCIGVLSTNGCVYRANIAQGNIIEQEDVDQIDMGMTKSQIRFLLGTPMIDDPFSKNRWDYVYYLTLGRADAAHKRWISVYFEDEIVSEVRKDLELAPEL